MKESAKEFKDKIKRKYIEKEEKMVGMKIYGENSKGEEEKEILFEKIEIMTLLKSMKMLLRCEKKIQMMLKLIALIKG